MKANVKKVFSKKTNKGTSILNGGTWFLYKLINPKSQNEDLQRREFILNVILLSSILISLVAVIIILIDVLTLGVLYRGVPFHIQLYFTLIFCCLYLLSRKGYFMGVSFFVILFYLGVATFTIYMWGIDIPLGLLTYVLIITMAGVLISTKTAFIVTFVSSFLIVFLGYLQNKYIIYPDLYWKKEMLGVQDAIVIVFIFFIIMLISWLSNREIDKSFIRAKNAEEELKKERDFLEIKVIEKTKKLRQVEMEKMTQIYRLASFGRLASGLFHDLANPLSVVALGTKRMENFMQTVRRQIQQQEEKDNFSLDDEIRQTAQILRYKAKESNIEIVLQHLEPAEIYGSSLKFSQVVSNLISNAIDAYDDLEIKNREAKIFVNLQVKNNLAYLDVQDEGRGISSENIDRIFDPFFTTKRIDKGVGIGLSVCKEIVEKDFGGKIEVESNGFSRTIFIAIIPLKQDD